MIKEKLLNLRTNTYKVMGEGESIVQKLSQDNTTKEN
jgi:hypothetical protein